MNEIEMVQAGCKEYLVGLHLKTELAPGVAWRWSGVVYLDGRYVGQFDILTGNREEN